MAIRNIFEENKRPNRILLLAIASMLAIVALGIFQSLGWDFVKIKNFFFSTESTKYWVSVLVGLLTSILAAVIYETVAKRRNESAKLQELREIADEDLTIDNLLTLEKFGKRNFRDFTIECELKKHSNSNFFLVRVEYSFTKQLLTSKLHFEFSRITNEDDRKTVKSRDDNTHYEFFEAIDETDFTVPGVITDVDYKVTDPIVTIDGKNLPLTLSKVVENNNIIFRADIPRTNFKQNHPASFEFCVEFPLEKDSFHDFVFDLPLHGMSCSFDYSDVEAEIFIAGNYYISSHTGPTIVERALGKKHCFHIRNNGWMMPKSALLFIWWLK